MSMNLIAMLVSLAMMLTGVGGIDQPEAAPPAGETARTLTLSNVNVTWNGETLHLDPQVRFGVSTDGRKALYDFAVELGDKVLLPMQLSAGEKGVTVLSGNSGIAVNFTAEALVSLAAQMEEQVNASLVESGDENAQLLQFLPVLSDILRSEETKSHESRQNHREDNRLPDMTSAGITVLHVFPVILLLAALLRKTIDQHDHNHRRDDHFRPGEIDPAE
jgi:hypothetical protein